MFALYHHCQVLMRTSKNWQNMLVGATFRQWSETVKNTKRQREKLARYLGKLKGVTAADIFRKWKAYYTALKLNRVSQGRYILHSICHIAP